MQKQANLSEEQVQVLLYLRRLYIHRRGALHLKRQAQVSKPYLNSNTMHPQQELDHVAELAAALKEIAMQDCKAYHLVSHAMCRGVSHPAVLMSLPMLTELSKQGCMSVCEHAGVSMQPTSLLQPLLATFRAINLCGKTVQSGSVCTSLHSPYNMQEHPAACTAFLLLLMATPTWLDPTFDLDKVTITA